MKRWISLLLILCFSCSFAFAASKEPQIMRTTGSVNMRSGANTSHSIIATIPPNAAVHYNGKTSGDWYYVTYNTKNGWIHSDYVHVITWKVNERTSITAEPTRKVTTVPANMRPISFVNDVLPFIVGLAIGLIVWICTLVSNHNSTKSLIQRYESNLRSVRLQEHAAVTNSLNAQWQKKYDYEMENVQARIQRVESLWESRLSSEKKQLEQFHQARENALLQELRSSQDTNELLVTQMNEYKDNHTRFIQNQSLREYLAMHPDAPDLSRGVVYMERSANCSFFHHEKHCIDKDVILVSRVYADLIMLQPCPYCTNEPQPAAEITVEVALHSNGYRPLYHAKGNRCIQYGISIPLSQAINRDYSPCPKCRPPYENPTIWF